MNQKKLREVLRLVSTGEMSVEQAELLFKTAPIHELSYANLDIQRGIRQGVSEVVYGEGKTAQQIVEICSNLICAGQDAVLVTRVDDAKQEQVYQLFRESTISYIPYVYHEAARLILVGDIPQPDGNGYIAIIAAGTSDVSVAEEAAITAEFLGNKVVRHYDVGVAGIHRLLAHVDDLVQAHVVVAVAGMEGALASVVAGLTSCPVIAVPTSVGYGASFGGMAALLAMLNSCASGVSVVNIDNGFGAGYQAHLINHAYIRPMEQGE